MSVISFDDSYVGATSVSGEGATSYTCPSNKRAEVIVSMILSVIDIDFFNGSFDAYITKTYTFKVYLQPNDVLVFAQSGNGAITVSSIGCSFSKNTVTQESKVLSTVGLSGGRYSANISYSAKEMLN